MIWQNDRSMASNQPHLSILVDPRRFSWRAICDANIFLFLLFWFIISNLMFKIEARFLMSMMYYLMTNFLPQKLDTYTYTRCCMHTIWCFQTHRVIIIISNYLSFSEKINTFFDCNQKSNKKLTFITYLSVLARFLRFHSGKTSAYPSNLYIHIGSWLIQCEEMVYFSIYTVLKVIEK